MRLVCSGMVIPIRDDNPTTKKPVLTIAIIIACIYIFAFVQPRQSAPRRSSSSTSTRPSPAR